MNKKGIKAEINISEEEIRRLKDIIQEKRKNIEILNAKLEKFGNMPDKLSTRCNDFKFNETLNHEEASNTGVVTISDESGLHWIAFVLFNRNGQTRESAVEIAKKIVDGYNS